MVNQNILTGEDTPCQLTTLLRPEGGRKADVATWVGLSMVCKHFTCSRLHTGHIQDGLHTGCILVAYRLHTGHIQSRIWSKDLEYKYVIMLWVIQCLSIISIVSIDTSFFLLLRLKSIPRPGHIQVGHIQ